MPNQTSTTTVRSRYAEQAAADLAENRRLQQELTEKIAGLKQEETLLADILRLAEGFEASPETPSLPQQAQEEPALPEQAQDEPALPQQAQEEPVLASPAPAPASDGESSRGPAKARVKNTTPKAAATTAGRKSGKSTAPAAKETSRQPLLGDIFMGLLGEHDEPLLAKELRDELEQKHPERTPTPQVVRNTLEALVAKGRIQRHKQKRSVMYSVIRQAA